MITKASLILLRKVKGQTQLLFVLTEDSPYYLFPGGTMEEGEAIEVTLNRELDEELGVAAKNIAKLGVVEGTTVTNRPLTMHLFAAELVGVPEPQAEVIHLVWMDKQAVSKHRSQMTPITLTKVLPFLEHKGLW